MAVATPTVVWPVQPPNRAKAAISIIRTVLTTANVRYTSPIEDGATFIDLPLGLVPRRENQYRKYNLRLIKSGRSKFIQSSLNL
jgi:hypothetical protein